MLIPFLAALANFPSTASLPNLTTLLIDLVYETNPDTAWSGYDKLVEVISVRGMGSRADVQRTSHHEFRKIGAGKSEHTPGSEGL
jgi:hypothetical protein